ncbi:S46 family peptidase [Rheinheimera marina]|uniref:Dipeptidyl-peptidase n=1 Tax=Rheinheimera marina TaxID=1774958 RepID=A0ABV9JLV3_9GAMM
MKKTLLTLALSLASLAQADEGMWQPHQLPELEAVLKAKGLQIEAASIAQLTAFPMNAVISLGGCTASFVSPQGLVVTNHHCAYGSIQHNSTADNNLLANGFLATSMDKELPAAPGAKVFVTQEVSNVTPAINQELSPQLKGKARFDKIDELRKSLVADCETPGYRCDVYSFHGGLEYYLIKQMEIRDVRLVHAPASGVGKFGGDIDNWMWPRHTGDYSFYRAYVGKDGQPADFSADNVPFTPPSYLKVSAKGVAENDFVMVIGYPGRTNRYNSAADVRNQFTQVLPQSKAYREQAMAVIKQHAPEGSEARIKYESILAGLANYAKNFEGMIQSYQSGGTQQRKDEFEKVLNRWIKSSPARQAKYAPAVRQLNQLVAQQAETQQRDLVLNYFGYAQLFSTAEKLYRLAQEQQKPDAERETGYQQRDLERFSASMKRLSRSFDVTVEQELALHFLKQYASLPKTQHLAAFDSYFALDGAFDEAAVTEKLAGIYQNTKLTDEAERLTWMGKSVEEFKASTDPLIQFAVALYDSRMTLEQEQKEQAGLMAVARPLVMEAVIAFNKSLGKPVYADANSTLRVTYGSVQGYSPKDAVTYQPFTTTAGILQKATGVEPFDAPKAQLEAIKEGDFGIYKNAAGQLPVNFLSTVDTTGGNSGSPTLNGKAELVGLLFDGVIEGIIANWDYDPATNRSIHVDSRYMLWQMENVDGASNLLKEMSIVTE